MIGLDTNVLVRYIMQDDSKQSAKATKLIESLDADRPGYITMVSVVELYWVLRLPLNFGALSPGFMRRSCAEPPASVARIAWG